MLTKYLLARHNKLRDLLWRLSRTRKQSDRWDTTSVCNPENNIHGGQRETHLGPTGPREARIGHMLLAIWERLFFRLFILVATNCLCAYPSVTWIFIQFNKYDNSTRGHILDSPCQLMRSSLFHTISRIIKSVRTIGECMIFYAQSRDLVALCLIKT